MLIYMVLEMKDSIAIVIIGKKWSKWMASFIPQK